MTTRLLLLVVLLAAGCAKAPDPRLNGTFVSDQAATMAHLRATGAYSQRGLDTFEGILGKLTVTYQGTTCTSRLGGYVMESRFKVRERGQNYLVLELAGDEMLPGGSTSRLDFVADGYWLTTSTMLAPYREKFTRVTTAPPDAPR